VDGRANSVKSAGVCTYYVNEELDGKVAVPPRVDSKGEPRWEEQLRTGCFEWHDHRMHWMQGVVEVRTLTSIVDTAFGRAVLVKITVFLGIVALRAINRRRLLPALGRAAHDGSPPGAAGAAVRRTLRAALGVAGDWKLEVGTRVTEFDEYRAELRVPIR
jgi:hypothetical protein